MEALAAVVLAMSRWEIFSRGEVPGGNGMTIRIGINGFGRIGRNMFRAIANDPLCVGIG